MALKVKFVGALRHISGKTQLSVNTQEAATVQQLVETLSRQIPELSHTLRSQELNDPRSNTLILVNGREISVLGGYEAQLEDGDEVVFIPVVHGG